MKETKYKLKKIVLKRDKNGSIRRNWKGYVIENGEQKIYSLNDLKEKFSDEEVHLLFDKLHWKYFLIPINDELERTIKELSQLKAIDFESNKKHNITNLGVVETFEEQHKRGYIKGEQEMFGNSLDKTLDRVIKWNDIECRWGANNIDVVYNFMSKLKEKYKYIETKRIDRDEITSFYKGKDLNDFY